MTKKIMIVYLIFTTIHAKRMMDNVGEKLYYFQVKIVKKILNALKSFIIFQIAKMTISNVGKNSIMDLIAKKEIWIA